MAAWTDCETLKLIELWSEDDVQAQLEGCKRNRAVFEKISQGMNDAGFQRTANQCREKIKNLRAEYKKVKDNNQTGNNRKTCKFYEKLDSVLGSKPATRPPVVNDSFLDSSYEDNDSSEGQKSEDCESSSASVSNNEQSSDLGTEKSPSGQSIEQSAADKKPLAKKKRSRDEKIEKAMGTLVSGITNALSGSDERFLQLEEKRIKLDEMMLKMEEDQRKESDEREERRRRDEREFQLKSFTLLCSNTQAAPPPMMASSYYYSHSTGSGSSTASCDNMYDM